GCTGRKIQVAVRECADAMRRLRLRRHKPRLLMLKRMLLLGWLGCAGQVFAATAPAPLVGPTITPAAVQMVQQSIHKLSAKVEVDSIQPAQVPGFYQVIASGQMVYISTDGKYLMHGDVVDLARSENLSDDAWAKFRKTALARVPASQRIVYAPANPKYTITVFTDVNCGFCRALHEHMAAFAAATKGHSPPAATCANPVKDQFELGLKLGVSGTPTIFGPDGDTLG